VMSRSSIGGTNDQGTDIEEVVLEVVLARTGEKRNPTLRAEAKQETPHNGRARTWPSDGRSARAVQTIWKSWKTVSERTCVTANSRCSASYKRLLREVLVGGHAREAQLLQLSVQLAPCGLG
jgi:hypothetical protein